jgi:hypothetical protein
MRGRSITIITSNMDIRVTNIMLIVIEVGMDEDILYKYDPKYEYKFYQ